MSVSTQTLQESTECTGERMELGQLGTFSLQAYAVDQQLTRLTRFGITALSTQHLHSLPDEKPPFKRSCGQGKNPLRSSESTSLVPRFELMNGDDQD